MEQLLSVFVSHPYLPPTIHLAATCQGIKSNPTIGLRVSLDNSTVAFGQNVTLSCTQPNRPSKHSSVLSTHQCVYDPQPDGREYWLSGPPVECPLVDCGSLPTLAGVEFQGDSSLTSVFL